MHKFFIIPILIAFSLVSLETAAKSDLGIGIKVFEKMQEAQVQIDAKNYAAALTMLDELLLQSGLNNYEIAQTLSIKGSVYFQQEEIAKALEIFKKVITYENIPKGFLEINLRTLAQLSFMEDDYQASLDYARQLQNISETPDANNYMLIGQIYYKLENYAKALENINIAIKLEQDIGKQVKENWLLILNAVYYSLNDYPNMIKVLEQIIALYPRERYMLSLAAVYGQLEKTEKQLLLMEPLYDKGLLTQESELLNLANLMLLHKAPYKGAKIIEKGFADKNIKRTKRNLEMAAQAWQLAAEDEKSVVFLAEAAELSEDGNTYMTLGQTYMNLYRWKDAESALEKALKKGDLRKEGDTHLLLGMTRFHQKQYLSARRAFVDAKDHDYSAKLAEQWITYMRQEQEKEEAAELIN